MIPKHVGIIMDGNRRYAQQQGWPARKGHEQGEKTLQKVLSWAQNAGVKVITLYALSLQNLSREKEEVEFLFLLARKLCKKLLKEKDDLEKRGIRICFIGKKSALPEDIQELFSRIEQETKTHSSCTINFAVAYGGREEIEDAANQFRTANDSTASFSSYLWLAEDMDMVIRTGGDHRTSNFFPWQTWYAEWFFLDTLWPAFTEEEFLSCINSFSLRKRRFGH